MSLDFRRYMMSEQWLSNRVEYIKGLKSPSVTQKTLVELYEIPETQRTPINIKHLNTLIKAEKAADKAVSAQRAAKKVLTEDQAKKRKERTHKLVQLGALFEVAGLDNYNPSALLGVLLKAAEVPVDDQKWDIWADHGQMVLNQRKNSKIHSLDAKENR